MKVIVDHRRVKVIFDEKNNEYIKEFNPKLENKIKFFLRLRKYPGKNFLYIARSLEKLGIKVPVITSVSKYKVVTKDIGGELLIEYLEKNKGDKEIIKKFLDIIVKVLKSNIYFGDFNTGNFIVKDKEIYALDLEDYRKVKLFQRDESEAIKRLEKTLKNKEWIEYIKKELRK